MDFISELWTRAKKLEKKIVFPETGDPRILKAADHITKAKLASVILVGDKKSIEENAKRASADISRTEIAHPGEEQNHVFGAKMVRSGTADGLVMGADNPTAETIRTAIHHIGLDNEASLISSFFMMMVDNTDIGEDGVIFFADCGVVPNPNAEELASIALSTAGSFRKLLFEEPRIAMLSFSTKGSAHHPDVDKVVQATKIAKSKKPDLVIDGEMQADAAIVPSVAKKKAPDSAILGDANVLIFPDLDSGNISYKLAQRIGGARAYGPVFQGTAKPINDLSRGCSVEDIINVTAITAVQAE